MNEKEFRKIAIDALVAETHVAKNNVYIVWMCKTLQNNKALLSTNINDGLYWEFTWDGDKDRGYLETKKHCSLCF